jgi:hypothetical protein
LYAFNDYISKSVASRQHLCAKGQKLQQELFLGGEKTFPAIEPTMIPLSRSPHSAGIPRNAPAIGPTAPSWSCVAARQPRSALCCHQMPYRGQRDRSAGTVPVSADHADGLDSPVSTLPCMSRSSLQQAFRLRQRIPAQPTPQNKEPNRKRSLPGLSTYRNG